MFELFNFWILQPLVTYFFYLVWVFEFKVIVQPHSLILFKLLNLATFCNLFFLSYLSFLSLKFSCNFILSCCLKFLSITTSYIVFRVSCLSFLSLGLSFNIVHSSCFNFLIPQPFSTILLRLFKFNVILEFPPLIFFEFS